MKNLWISFVNLGTPWYLGGKKSCRKLTDPSQRYIFRCFNLNELIIYNVEIFVKMFSWTMFLLKVQKRHKTRAFYRNFSRPKYEHHCCLQNGVLRQYVLDSNVLFCKMPSFGQACSITIPMNINPQWKIALKTIPPLKCSRERILIAMALRRKTVVAEIFTANKTKSLHFAG